MLDFLGTIATVALTIFIISTLLAVLDVSRGTKIVMAALLGLWVGVATAGSAAGWAALTKPFPIMGLFVVAPLIVAIVATAWPKARAAMLGLPLPLLVGMNVAGCRLLTVTWSAGSWAASSRPDMIWASLLCA